MKRYVQSARIMHPVMALAVLLLVLTACGSKSGSLAGNNGNAAAPSGSSGQLEQVKQSGVLRVGTEGTYAPFTYHDASGKLTGFDVDIAQEVAKRLGAKAEFIETQWDGMLAGLDAARFDTVFNEVSIREDRKQKYDFSDPYIVSKAVLIVRQDNQDIRKLADLKGKKSGQSLTSNLRDIAEKNGAEIVAVDGFNQAIDLLTSRRIDATINDNLSYLDAKKQRPDLPLKVVAETENASQSAALFKKGSTELVKAVNQALADMKSDGTYLKISKAYFNQDVSK
ncbi:amino acid ABC transporter substrate-binding protein [Paenibacillus sp. JX-17]|uniref:Amino acid ABC transporter substrate-binding protein n=1 Tax=Paenibacillus lacisoli TaxID=3064525 RepID=A0ABT9CC15_9BACL|nr:amino acid ABC transporter substrate-binding protein [Paenibacillus sp. JX-17]MDO7906415.1 amino acid ABC transporter substrate-binding protein [Paenibacillus sp. JX-17]